MTRPRLTLLHTDPAPLGPAELRRTLSPECECESSGAFWMNHPDGYRLGAAIVALFVGSMGAGALVAAFVR